MTAQILAVLFLLIIESLSALIRGARKRRIPSSDVAVFTRQMAIMVISGVPLFRALEFYAASGSSRLSPIIESVAEQVEQGRSLSLALANFPEVFSAVYVALVEVAEESGKLGALFSRLADMLERQLDLQRKVTSTLAYPVMLLGCSLLAILFFVYFCLPLMTPVLMEVGPLPWPTRVLLACRSLVPLLLLAIGLGVGLSTLGRAPIRRYLKANPDVELSLHSIPFAIPKVATLTSKICSARILGSAATMLEAGLTLTNSLSKAANASGNAVMRLKIEKVVALINEGASFEESLRLYDVFPPTAVSMLVIGEQTGTLPRMFSYVADHFDEDVERELHEFVALAEPILMGVMGVLVGVVVVGSLMPTLKLMQKL